MIMGADCYSFTNPLATPPYNPLQPSTCHNPLPERRPPSLPIDPSASPHRQRPYSLPRRVMDRPRGMEQPPPSRKRQATDTERADRSRRDGVGSGPMQR